MIVNMTPTIWILWVFAIPSLVATYYFYDRLVRIVHDNYPDLWSSLGKPVGWFWSPTGVQFRSFFQKHDLFWSITFRTPTWTQGRHDVAQALRLYRCSYLAFWLSFPVAILLSRIF